MSDRYPLTELVLLADVLLYDVEDGLIPKDHTFIFKSA